MKTTHFGFKSIASERKPQAVDAVFDSVARRYDLMNDLMSVGLHRLWKRHVIAQMGVHPGMTVLDLAGGTGDLTRRIAEKLEGKGQVWLADVNGSMLRLGRDRLLDRGLIVPLVQCDAENLPFPDGAFDRVVVAFGLRNMTHKDRAIAEARRVLAPGGQLFILEFSRIDSRLQKSYDLYSFNLLPRLGKWLVDDADSYRYLVESIRVHPDQAALRQMMIDQGFDHVSYENLSAGIVAIHRGVRR